MNEEKGLSSDEALLLLKKGVKLEYQQDDFWWILHKDSPIRLLWEYKIRKSNC